ncbi:putative Myb/SANT-like domain-containing protein [Rosa chinensis]|uniref:Putative Myb/SANT-like domain-containing protein n=1 Tax=Rosa chinensis TaxID=74649 RepID=A0A2P6SH88_ROSCH|nr:L10-interacting MYB domain-containing protein [Rosa chinensis]PRQ58029.1 putative Myb/SANT-like domain-containing protein [Rosa chinensis]
MASNEMEVDDKAEWSAKNEGKFIRILHEHVKKGDMQTSTFKKKIWVEISDELFAESTKRYVVPQLKSKFNRLRKKHREFSDLIEHTGFGWDPIANTVTASEEVWATYIKRVPGVKPYRKKGLEHYEILGEIFNTTTATGQLHYASSQLPPNSDEERELENKFLNNGVHINLDEDFNINNAQIETKGKRKAMTEAPASERRTKKWDKMEAYLEICGEVMKEKLQQRKEKNTEENKEKYSIEECVQIVETLGDIDHATLIKMMDKLIIVEWRRLFLSMSDERRRAWLANL